MYEYDSKNRVITAAAQMLSKACSAGNTGDTASTDLAVCQGPTLLILRVLAVCHCSIQRVLRVYWQYFGICTFIPPELRAFRGYILRVSPVVAVIWEDIASFGNILGLYIYCGYTATMGQNFVWPILIALLTLRVLVALKYTLSKHPVYSRV